VSVASAFANLIKVFFLVVLIIAITLGGIYWFDYLGIVDYNRLIQPVQKHLPEEAKRLEEEKKVLSEKIGAYDNYKDNVRKQAQYFTSMPPKAAVDRLAKLDELLAIDILRQIDRTAEEQGKASIVPYFLSLMDPEKAASIQRKMTKMGGQEG
jgi:flagellar motility protein MotE (MotC chaperone)